MAELPTQDDRGPWYRRTAVLAAGALALGLGAGLFLGVATTPEPTATEEYQALQARLDGTEAELSGARRALAEAGAELEALAGELPAREQAVREAGVALDERERALTQSERRLERADKALRKRERTVGILERRIQRNTVPGNGIFEVGVDITPGTYRTAGAKNCYFAVTADPNGAEITANNITSGPALVALAEGEFFETSGCADWALSPATETETEAEAEAATQTGAPAP